MISGMHITVHTDGGARGNPGPAAIGVVIKVITSSEDGPATIAAFGKHIGETTNNVAEYRAVIEALRSMPAILGELQTAQGSRQQPKPHHESGVPRSGMQISFFLDSALVVNQLKGLYKIKQPHLRTLAFEIKALEQEAGGTITYTHIPREQNKEADAQVNMALDRLM